MKIGLPFRRLGGLDGASESGAELLQRGELNGGQEYIGCGQEDIGGIILGVLGALSIGCRSRLTGGAGTPQSPGITVAGFGHASSTRCFGGLGNAKRRPAVTMSRMLSRRRRLRRGKEQTFCSHVY